MAIYTHLSVTVPEGCFRVDAEALRRARTGVPTGAFHS
jgi:hypothetical protein